MDRMDPRENSYSKKQVVRQKIEALHNEMAQPDFWSDKERAQEKVRELEDLKLELEGVGKYDRGNATMAIYSGVGGDDAEDFARMLFEMYEKFISARGWTLNLISANETSIGGIKHILFEIEGKSVYGTLKSEAGVHRLVRISPFNASGKRQTSFAMVEVLPDIKSNQEAELAQEDVEIEFSKSGGPGGQNVNKRETAVRATHTPTGIVVHVTSERSQEQNREKALAVLRARVWERREAERKRTEEGMSISSSTDAEWGNQIRSYVLDPYKLVKDHRTGVEKHDVDQIFNGYLEPFIEAFQSEEHAQ